MNPRGAVSILSSKVKLGAGVSAAAGPKGRDAIAATDVALRAEVLSYSKSRGLFAGAFLEGSTLRPDNGANKKLYRRTVGAKEIVLDSRISAPAAAELLLSELNKRTPKDLSSYWSASIIDGNYWFVPYAMITRSKTSVVDVQVPLNMTRTRTSAAGPEISESPSLAKFDPINTLPPG